MNSDSDDDDDLPMIVERGRTMEAAASRERGGGSPDPPRNVADELLDDLAEEEETYDEFNAELEGLEHRSEATGYYAGSNRHAKFPKDLKVEVVNYGDLYKSCTCPSERVGEVFEAMIAGTRYNDDVKANPPIGSWHLYVDHFSFVDGERTAEFRFDVVPGDGLSREGTQLKYSETSIRVTCDLLPHKAGPRAWTFSIQPLHPIDHCAVKIYAKQKKVVVLARKQTPALWDSPGTLYAPVTKDNYREKKKNNSV